MAEPTSLAEACFWKADRAEIGDALDAAAKAYARGAVEGSFHVMVVFARKTENGFGFELFQGGTADGAQKVGLLELAKMELAKLYYG